MAIDMASLYSIPRGDDRVGLGGNGDCRVWRRCMTTALQRAAESAEETAREQQAIARRLRTVKRQREAGMTWGQVLDRGAASDALALLRRSTARVTGSLRTVSQTIARGLAAEGESRRKIASRLGVTHQRITAMIRK
jgi:hypothetical protein